MIELQVTVEHACSPIDGSDEEVTRLVSALVKDPEEWYLLDFGGDGLILAHDVDLEYPDDWSLRECAERAIIETRPLLKHAPHGKTCVYGDSERPIICKP